MRVMMDPQFPNECVGEGRNCYYSILEDYNSFLILVIQLMIFYLDHKSICGLVS